ncbi:zinc ribbon domain-containing protein [Nitratidesulfovibrio liaohensis]|uniref:Zinc ribbon domain-containing protein n=1 Tax=Nitratidesulfovibrio liaohensis TaxID=2604158 RepID=A0ABY9R7T1_9BACT|nr:zinc ribbon domain-containing protein [Nitratidesulfovibrio liaohensis]WMW67098.1 zinc ribbon domain-containing protein [Nitratidesulfovibrio liaohensis]
MPIYEYRCSDCEQIFEEWLKTFDEAPRSCPVCGGHADRIVSNTSFVLKGGGWYVTDYGNRSSTDSQAGASAEASGNGDAGPNGSSKSGASGGSADSGTAAASSGTATSGASPATCASAAPSGGCGAASTTGS